MEYNLTMYKVYKHTEGEYIFCQWFYTMSEAKKYISKRKGVYRIFVQQSVD